jgi:hypothetical protein
MRSAQSILINVDGAVLKAVEALYDKKGKPRAGVSSDDDLGDYLSLDLLKKTSAEILDTLAMHMVHEESRRAVLAVAIAMISNLSGESPYVWIHGALCRAGKTSTECERVVNTLQMAMQKHDTLRGMTSKVAGRYRRERGRLWDFYALASKPELAGEVAVSSGGEEAGEACCTCIYLRGNLVPDRILLLLI